MYACIHLTSGLTSGGDEGALLRCAEGFSPAAESDGGQSVVFGVSGLGVIYGEPERIAGAVAERARQEGLAANVAVSWNVEAAKLLARHFPGVTALGPGETEAAVSALEVGALPLPPAVLGTLALWGVRTLGEFAALPEAGLARRLGPETAGWRRMARGALERPLVGAARPAEFRAGLELEDPIELLEALVFALGRCLSEVCARLWASGLAAGGLDLRLSLGDGSCDERLVELPLPLGSARTLLRIVRLEIEKRPPDNCVRAISVAARPAEPRRLQRGLFLPGAPEPERLELTLAKIRALVGEDRVGVPELIDTHHPRPFRLVPGRLPEVARAPAPPGPRRPCLLSTRHVSPPEAAEVATEAGRPARVKAGRISGKVIAAAGPWKAAGDWWGAGRWEREEWDVALAGGSVLRIFSDETGWHLDGTYD